MEEFKKEILIFQNNFWRFEKDEVIFLGCDHHLLSVLRSLFRALWLGERTASWSSGTTCLKGVWRRMPSREPLCLHHLKVSQTSSDLLWRTQTRVMWLLPLTQDCCWRTTRPSEPSLWVTVTSWWEPRTEKFWRSTRPGRWPCWCRCACSPGSSDPALWLAGIIIWGPSGLLLAAASGHVILLSRWRLFWCLVVWWSTCCHGEEGWRLIRRLRADTHMHWLCVCLYEVCVVSWVLLDAVRDVKVCGVPSGSDVLQTSGWMDG